MEYDQRNDIAVTLTETPAIYDTSLKTFLIHSCTNLLQC